MSAIRKFLQRIKATGSKRPGAVMTTAMGTGRTFDAYDVGADTFVFERGISRLLDGHPSVLVVDKCDLRRRARGRVLTMTSGNHAVAALPLLDGRFWKLSTLRPEDRSEALMHRVLCANVVGGKIEVSQREIPTPQLVEKDRWLTETVGFSLADIVMGERNDATLEHYRRLGQEWRVKPLAWTEAEMRVALAASRKRISSRISYYHSMKGVHFLSFAEFARFLQLAETDLPEFMKGLRELVSVYEGNRFSFSRMPKYRGHHEVEFFGLKRGVAQDTIVPELEKLLESVALGRIGQLGMIQRAQEILSLYQAQLSSPELADENARLFTDTLYMYITGEIYSIVGEGLTPAFDDRRIALPGATFVAGRPVMYPGADSRSEVLLSNLRGLMSKDEVIEYANVYELRDEESDVIGGGRTREVVYKTSLRPLESSLIEKGLSSRSRGYGEYMLARVGVLRALGVSLSGYYRVLRHRAGGSGPASDFYIRMRCEGEPMETIPANYFSSVDGTAGEEKEVVLALATLMGDAAAQNMAMKKFDPRTQSPLYGVGKEIYEFEYDIVRELVVPKKVSTCSIRGSFGWPSLDYTDENLDAIANFYLGHFAHAIKAYQRQHASVTMAEIAERFMGGFEFRTHALEWQVSVMRDKFEAFDPALPARYDFRRKWHFVMWSLERQERRLPILRKRFFEKVRVVENEASSEEGLAERKEGAD